MYQNFKWLRENVVTIPNRKNNAWSQSLKHKAENYHRSSRLKKIWLIFRGKGSWWLIKTCTAQVFPVHERTRDARANFIVFIGFTLLLLPFSNQVTYKEEARKKISIFKSEGNQLCANNWYLLKSWNKKHFWILFIPASFVEAKTF